MSKKFSNANNAENLSKDLQLYQHTFLSTQIPDRILVSTVERGSTRNLI